MKKRFLAILLCAMMVMALLPTAAFAAVGDTFTVEGLNYEVLTEGTGDKAGTVKLTGYSGNPTDVAVGTVQNAGNRYKVTEVGNKAFFCCLTLKSLNLPEATSIGNNAFYDCDTLASLSLPKAETIGDYAFFSCGSLASLSLPEAETIGQHAFNKCDSLENIDLPKAISIGICAFLDCTELASVSLPEVTSIGALAFTSCTALASVSLPEATSIGALAFTSCTALASVTILQTTAPVLGTDAFRNVPLNCTFYIPLNATGYTITYGWLSTQVFMWPVSGTVYDEDGNPAADRTVSAGGYNFTTAADGSYTAFVMPNFTGDVTATVGGNSKSISLNNVSAELSGKDIFFGTVATPTFEPAEGTFTGTQSVTIDCGTAGATIRYTTDGTEPTATSTEYTGEISVTDTTTIKAKAFKTGLADSETADISYTISYSVTLPSGTGYTVAAEGTSTSPTTKGGNYSFTLTIDSNYEKGAGFAVKANGTVLMPSGDVYTIENITSAQTVTVEGIVMKNADYTAVDMAIASIPTDLSQYTEETANVVTTAKNAVIRGKKIDEQSTVNGYATAINSAVSALQYKDADYSKVDAAIASIPDDLSVYTEETVTAVNEAKDAVIRGKNITEQAIVNGYATAINDAVKALKYKAADYRKVDTAISNIPSDLSVYTEDTARAVINARNSVVRGKNITEQSTVDGYAIAIVNAVAGLKYKAADYSAVDAAVAKANLLNRADYVDFSGVISALLKVEYGKDIREQSIVDSYAKNINNMLAALVRKTADYTEVDKAVAKANALNKSDYNDFSRVEAAVAAVKYGISAGEQATVDSYARAINSALAAIVYKAADYSATKSAIEKAKALDKSEYEDFSKVESAINSVVYGKSINEQVTVDSYAKAINDALSELKFRNADYIKVREAIALAYALNKNDYVDYSAVEAAISTVVYDKSFKEQAIVDVYAKSITDAINALAKKTVTPVEEISTYDDDASKNSADFLILFFTVGQLMYIKSKKKRI